MIEPALRTRIFGALVASLGLLGACAPQEAALADGGAETEAAEAPALERPAAHVDSILPIEEHLRRFRSELVEPAGLTGGASSREALVERFRVALAARDTAAFAGMLLTQSEFAWLYYPHTRYTVPPYRLAPEILWMQIGNGSSRGFHRLLDRLGGTALDVRGHRCSDAPLVEGPNRSWEACALQIAAPDGTVAETRLFGTILERDGVFKFVSYTNDF